TLRDAVNEALRDWMSSVETTHYIIGSVIGPHPFPRIVRDFQSVIGREARQQSLDRIGKLPDLVEAGGRGPLPGDHASPLSYGMPGVLHGSYSYVMQDEDGQTCDVHSISAGLDYPGVGPEHSYWKDVGRVTYTNCLD